MLKWISLFFTNLFGRGIARMLGGAGLALTTGAVMIPLVTGALNLAAQSFHNIGADVLNVILLFGFGEALSIIGSALLTRMAMGATRVGIKRATAA